MGGARVTTLVTLRKCTLGHKREIKTLKFVSASTKGFKGGLAWIKPSKKDMAVTYCAWCQALSLPRPLVLRSVQPGFATRVFRVRSMRAWTQHRPHSVCPCGPALLAVGVAGGRPRGGCLPPL